MTQFTITTSDGLTLGAITNAPASPRIGILCFHMMPATKESYLRLLSEGERKNVLAWAIDFRGHGESTDSGRLDYEIFDDTDHQQYIVDARGAYGEMKKQLVPRAVIGASVGANIALKLQIEMDIPASILLSPGLNYRGIKTLPDAARLDSKQASFILSSEEVRQSGQRMQDETEQIFQAFATPHKQIEIFSGQDHGTAILDAHPEAMEKIFTFIEAEITV